MDYALLGLGSRADDVLLLLCYSNSELEPEPLLVALRPYKLNLRTLWVFQKPYPLYRTRARRRIQ
jgi:hypothetical protein